MYIAEMFDIIASVELTVILCGCGRSKLIKLYSLFRWMDQEATW